MSTYRIPFSLLPYFSLTEDQRDHRCKDAFPVKSILQLLEEKKRSYFYDSFTALNLPPNGSNENRMALALKAARRKDHSLYLIYNSLPDSYGHKYGPISPELENAVREMDDQLESFVNIYKKEVGDATFIFLGDHGMLPVIKLFDAKKVLFDLSKESGLKLKKDFIYFLDSTLLRVWFFSERAKRLLPVALKKSDKFNQYGKFIDERMAQRFHVPWGDRRYGDIIWWADNGVLIYPDFFHNSEMAYRGMHGYDPELVECQGTCIVYGPNITSRTIDVLPLKSVFDILKRLLEI